MHPAVRPSLNLCLPRGDRFRGHPARFGTLCGACLATFICVMSAVPSAHAQPDEALLDDLDRQIEARGGVQALSSDDDIAPPAAERAAMGIRWTIFRAAEPGSDRESQTFDVFRSTVDELGIDTLPAHSLVLLQEADAAYESGDRLRAEQLRDWAEALSPESAQPSFFDARIAWAETPFSVGSVVRPLSEAYRRLDRDVAGNQAITIVTRRVALNVGMWTLLTLAIFWMVRHLGAFAFDLRIALLKAPALNQARVLAVLLVVAPALILASPVTWVFGAIVLAAAYMNIWERVAALIAILGMAWLPFLAEDIALAVARDEGDQRRIVAAVSSVCDVRCETQLDQLIARNPSPQARVARAWTLYRVGSADMVARAEALIDGVETSGPTLASLEVLRGNIAVLRGDPETASAHFESALDVAEHPRLRVAAAFNLYRARSALADSAGAEAALIEARQADVELTTRYVDYRGRSQNLVLMTAPLPSDVEIDYESGNRSADPILVERASSELLAGWMGAVPREAAFAGLGVLIGLLVLGGVARWLGVTSHRCSQCQTPTSRFVYTKAFDKQLCVLCYQLDAVGRDLTYVQRTARERRVDAAQERSRLAQIFVSVIVPGGGLLLSGRAITGLLLLVMAMTGVSLLVVDPTPLAIPYSLGTDRLFDGRVPVAIALLGIPYVVSGITGYLLSLGGQDDE